MAITDAEIADLNSRGYVSTLSKTVPLTDAQIKALPTTPITIVASPGAGKWIEMLGGSLYADCSAGAYGNMGGFGSRLFRFSNQAGAQLLDYTVSNVLDVTDAQVRPLSPQYADAVGGVQPNAVDILDKPLTLSITGGAGDFTDGHADNTLKVTAIYTIVEI